MRIIKQMLLFHFKVKVYIKVCKKVNVNKQIISLVFKQIVILAHTLVQEKFH